MKKRFIHVIACSDLGTRLQLTLSVETITKISQYSSSSEEKFRIEHIDSVSHLHDMNE